ncbi:MAG: sugar phosphate isomerase/epimerase [Rhizobium sp.]
MTTLGFQLYSAREYQPFSDVFVKVAKAGYKEVEGYGAMYAELDDAALRAMRADLDKNGLTMPTGHFGLDLLEGDPDRVLTIARTLGIESVYAPYLLPDQRPSDVKGWHDFGARLEKAGAPFMAAGLDFGWHNHDFEFVALSDGSLPMEQIFAGGPTLSWEADLAWVARGGADPFTWIKKFGSRITAVHVKDIAPAGENTDEGGWADVGHGTLDWAKLVAALKDTGARHYIVEHDNPNDLDRVVTRSIESFKTY